MASKSFSAQVDAFIAKCKIRSDAVIKTAIQAAVDEANTPTAQGGRLRVDTSFLRNSIGANIGSMPSGPSNPRTDPMGAGADPVALVIAKVKAGDTLYVGWSASYARIREAHDGFVEAAAQNWPKHVAEAVAEVKRRIP